MTDRAIRIPGVVAPVAGRSAAREARPEAEQAERQARQAVACRARGRVTQVLAEPRPAEPLDPWTVRRELAAPERVEQERTERAGARGQPWVPAERAVAAERVVVTRAAAAVGAAQRVLAGPPDATAACP